jgi:hypothetical protein
MESSEHRQIGNSVTVATDLGVGLDPDGVIQLVISAPGLEDTTLTYGEVVALGGDFYGAPGEAPISSAAPALQTSLFLAAHQTLVAADRTELASIRRVLDYESSKVLGVPDPAAAFAALGESLYFQWNEITGGAPASMGAIGMATNPGRYTRLATHNLDHFGTDAVAAYRAGHTAACQTAGTDLNAALAMNAHADHFLSDLFAGGHMRTPRRVLSEYAWNMSSLIDRVTIGSLLSFAMHNEENLSGPTVTSQAANGHQWQAFGDRQVLEPSSKENFDAAVAALQASVDEVVASAARPDQAPGFDALNHVPYVAGIYPPTSGPSIAPVFVAVNGEPQARTGRKWILVGWVDTPGLGSTSDYHYTETFLWQSVVLETLGQQYLDEAAKGLFLWTSK